MVFPRLLIAFLLDSHANLCPSCMRSYAMVILHAGSARILPLDIADTASQDVV